MASQFSSRGSSAATATGRARGARDELNDPRPPSRDASVQATSGQSKGVSIEASYYEGTDVGCQASTESIGGVHGLATLAMPLEDGDELMRSIHAASSTRHAMGDSGSNMRRWGGSNKAPSAEAMTGTAGVRLPPGGTFRRGNAIGRGALPPRRSMESGKQASRQATPSSLAAAQEMSVETLVEAQELVRGRHISLRLVPQLFFMLEVEQIHEPDIVCASCVCTGTRWAVKEGWPAG